MKFPKVNNFLCCFTLETGGMVIGWFGAIFSALGVIAAIASIVMAIIGLLYMDEWKKSNNAQDLDSTAVQLILISKNKIYSDNIAHTNNLHL